MAQRYNRARLRRIIKD